MIKKRESIISDQELVDADTPRERIAQRAYELYQLRGCQDGFDLQDWLQAEQDVLSQTEQSDESVAVEREESRGRAATGA